MRRKLARGAADFVSILALMWAIALATAASHGKTFLVLSLTIAGMAAFNLAFLRHLRRVYASPRRGVWRRE
jgi:hypothetical protein